MVCLETDNEACASASLPDARTVYATRSLHGIRLRAGSAGAEKHTAAHYPRYQAKLTGVTGDGRKQTRRENTIAT